MTRELARPIRSDPMSKAARCIPEERKSRTRMGRKKKGRETARKCARKEENEGDGRSQGERASRIRRSGLDGVQSPARNKYNRNPRLTSHGSTTTSYPSRETPPIDRRRYSSIGRTPRVADEVADVRTRTEFRADLTGRDPRRGVRGNEGWTPFSRVAHLPWLGNYRWWAASRIPR